MYSHGKENAHALWLISPKWSTLNLSQLINKLKRTFNTFLLFTKPWINEGNIIFQSLFFRTNINVFQIKGTDIISSKPKLRYIVICRTLKVISSKLRTNVYIDYPDKITETRKLAWMQTSEKHTLGKISLEQWRIS